MIGSWKWLFDHWWSTMISVCVCLFMIHCADNPSMFRHTNTTIKSVSENLIGYCESTHQIQGPESRRTNPCPFSVYIIQFDPSDGSCWFSNNILSMHACNNLFYERPFHMIVFFSILRWIPHAQNTRTLSITTYRHYKCTKQSHHSTQHHTTTEMKPPPQHTALLICILYVWIPPTHPFRYIFVFRTFTMQLLLASALWEFKFVISLKPLFHIYIYYYTTILVPAHIQYIRLFFTYKYTIYIYQCVFHMNDKFC